MTTPSPTTHDPAHWRKKWALADDVIYLNHGSFGPCPKSVLQARQEWFEQVERDPMDFFLRRLEGHLDEAAHCLGELVGADGSDLVFVDNATAGINIVAANVPLEPGDQVLLTDHEYGAVTRIWRDACRRAGAELVVQALPSPLVSPDDVVAAIFAGAGERTRLIVLSHVTSPTAVILPVEQVCRRARELGISVCIDGPHALAMVDVNLRRIDCDFYAASCHKWLSAPLGSGFLFVARRKQQGLRPALTSWGRSISGRPFSWKDELTWPGTRDPSAFLAVPNAIQFLKSAGLDYFRETTHELARYARLRLSEAAGLEPIVPDSPGWYGSMVTLRLPAAADDPPEYNGPDPLADALWKNHRIEIVINRWSDRSSVGPRRRHIRVSCHLYNSRSDIDRLVDALNDESRKPAQPDVSRTPSR
jgi:isopenicillin-N epimerase